MRSGSARWQRALFQVALEEQENQQHDREEWLTHRFGHVPSALRQLPPPPPGEGPPPEPLTAFPSEKPLPLLVEEGTDPIPSVAAAHRPTQRPASGKPEPEGAAGLLLASSARKAEVYLCRVFIAASALLRRPCSVQPITFLPVAYPSPTPLSPFLPHFCYFSLCTAAYAANSEPKGNCTFHV